MAVGATHEAVKRLARSESGAGALFPIQLTESQLLLDDSYNANVGSMTAAVQVLSEMPGYRVLVVGDMAELGAKARCHRRGRSGESRADRVLSVGTLSAEISRASGVGEHFNDKARW
jgi:UDP-N-acetylmuramoyl-tripeptide--D-alanyl-D-alanine ligase